MLEDAVCRYLRIGALDALAGYIGGLREELRLMLDGIIDAVADIAHDTEVVIFLGSRCLHEKAHEYLCIVAVLGRHGFGDGCELLALTGLVEDWQVVGALVGGHFVGTRHALLEEGENAGIDAVEIGADFGKFSHGRPHFFWKRVSAG